MATYRYPFRTISGSGLPQPVLPIIISNPANSIEHLTWALIDTGADTSAVPEEIARLLYHNTRHPDVRKDCSCGIGGHTVVYFHTFSIAVLAPKPDGQVNLAKVAMRVSRQLIPVIPRLPVVILGQKDFLQKSILTLNYPKQWFSIRRGR
jgi:hypothetical protein